MHNAAFAATHLPHLYLRARVHPTELPRALAEARRLEVGGLNLTVPLKEAVAGLLDDLTPRARAIGAVNTVLPKGGRLVGDNTDGEGFLRALRGRVRLDHARVVVLGAGGGARAVATALAHRGSGTLVLANRTATRARALGAALARTTPRRPIEIGALDDPRLLDGAALVVNATSAGLGGAALPIRPARSPRSCLFVDLVYGRATPFLAAAARARRTVLDGAGMLLHQGALAFEQWTGQPAPLAAMRRALDVPPQGLPDRRSTRRRPA
jgi:shikimate dehydrogenase